MPAAGTRRRAKLTLPSDQQILIERDFAASRQRVWRAYTKPEHVRRWWTAGRGTLTDCEIDLRIGGRWRYGMRSTDGFEVAFHGEFQQIIPDALLVCTVLLDGIEGFEALNTVTFKDTDTGTNLEILWDHKSRAERDAHLQLGMESGLHDALALLEQAATDPLENPPTADAPERQACAN